MLGMYFGTIDMVLPPNHDFNVSKYQYEYIVLVTCDLYSQLQVRCVALDPFGSFNAFQDTIFDIGHRVFVQFPQGDRTVGIIMGGARFYGDPSSPDLGVRLQRRFNELVETYGKDGSWEIRSDAGPVARVAKDRILLDDASGESILIDKANKKILVNCQDWNLEVKGACVINVAGAATVKAASIAAEISGDAQVRAKSAKIETSGEATVKAGGTVKVDGSSIELNGSGGQVMTTGPQGSQPRCYVTGAPFVGVSNVKAG